MMKLPEASLVASNWWCASAMFLSAHSDTLETCIHGYVDKRVQEQIYTLTFNRPGVGVSSYAAAELTTDGLVEFGTSLAT